MRRTANTGKQPAAAGRAADANGERAAELVQQFQAALAEDFDAMLRGELEDIPHIHGYAERLCVHPTHLSNTLKQATGQAPCDFVNARFIAEAQQLLRDTQMSVADISYRLTFKDPTNFTKYFKRHVGLSPKAYREQYAGG